VTAVSPDPSGITEETRSESSSFVVYGDWLAVEIGSCNCAAPEFGDQILHEPGCGLEPVVELAELSKVLARAGHVLLALPKPVDDHGDKRWEYPGGGVVVAYATGRHDPELTAQTKAMALAMLAAAEYDERRHASASGVAGGGAR
jgi:hypothetical protein